MKALYSLFLFVPGILLVLAGALFTMLHWPGAHALLATGLVLEAAGLGFLLYVLVAKAKARNLPGA